jgi:hypothetical protein
MKSKEMKLPLAAIIALASVYELLHPYSGLPRLGTVRQQGVTADGVRWYAERAKQDGKDGLLLQERREYNGEQKTIQRFFTFDQIEKLGLRGYEL